ncbi:MAG: hypothetical protein AABW88_05585 [Nanoarchaeota archaeon]
MKKQTTKLSAMGFMLLAAIFASAGQIFFKFTADKFTSIISIFTNYNTYIAGTFLLVGLFFMLKALRRGELTVVYPVLATSFIWVSLLSPLFFSGDFMTFQKWSGVFIIIFGVTLVGKGRKK